MRPSTAPSPFGLTSPRPPASACTSPPAKANRATAPLYERFNETREMTELTVEASADLPWIGGWAIGSDAEAELSQENGTVRCIHPGLGIEVRWTLSSSEVRLFPESAN